MITISTVYKKALLVSYFNFRDQRRSRLDCAGAQSNLDQLWSQMFKAYFSRPMRISSWPVKLLYEWS